MPCWAASKECWQSWSGNWGSGSGTECWAAVIVFSSARLSTKMSIIWIIKKKWKANGMQEKIIAIIWKDNYCRHCWALHRGLMVMKPSALWLRIRWRIERNTQLSEILHYDGTLSGRKAAVFFTSCHDTYLFGWDSRHRGVEWGGSKQESGKCFLIQRNFS